MHISFSGKLELEAQQFFQTVPALSVHHSTLSHGALLTVRLETERRSLVDSPFGQRPLGIFDLGSKINCAELHRYSDRGLTFKLPNPKLISLEYVSLGLPRK